MVLIRRLRDSESLIKKYFAESVFRLEAVFESRFHAFRKIELGESAMNFGLIYTGMILETNTERTTI